MSYMPKIHLDPTDLLHIEYVLRAYLERFGQEDLVEIAREEELQNGVWDLSHSLNKLAENNGHSELLTESEYAILRELEHEPAPQPTLWSTDNRSSLFGHPPGEVREGMVVTRDYSADVDRYFLDVDFDDGTFEENPDPRARKSLILFRPTREAWREAYSLARSIIADPSHVADLAEVPTVGGRTLRTTASNA